MKVQTAFLLLCFLSGVFLSVVHAKPSPTLMRELVALEKYLEKKEGSDSVDGQNENEVKIPINKKLKTGIENIFDQNVGQNHVNQNLEQVEENKPIENGANKLKNENNNNGGGETNTEEGSGGGGEETPHANEPNTGQEEKPEAGDAPENAKEDSGPSVTGEETPPEEESSTDSGGKVEGEEGEKPQEGNRPSPSDGQVEKEREKIFADLDDLSRTIEDLPDKLSTLKDKFRNQFQNDDRKFKELEEKLENRKQKTTEKLGQLKTDVEDFESTIGKKSVLENAPARRSHISDTEFLNMLHSLLTYK